MKLVILQINAIKLKLLIYCRIKIIDIINIVVYNIVTKDPESTLRWWQLVLQSTLSCGYKKKAINHTYAGRPDSAIILQMARRGVIKDIRPWHDVKRL